MKRIVFLILLLTPLVLGQEKHPVSGRVYAHVMGVGGAPWLDRPEREAEEQPEAALDALDLQKGMIVADIGAGSGYYSKRLARRVGPTGKVFANDIQPQMLEILKRKMAAEKVTNIETVLGDIDDPKLPRACCDLILLVDVYHEFSEPQKMLRKIHDALKPSGRLVLLEFRKEDPKVPIRLEHKMTVAEVRMELEAENYKFDSVNEKLPWQHILIFRPVATSATPQ